MALPKNTKPPSVVSGVYTGGYTGSGWDYGGQNYPIPTNQSTTPGGATAVGGPALGTLPSITPPASANDSGLPGGVNEAQAPDFTIEDYMAKLQSDPLWGTGESAFQTSIDRAQQQMVHDPFNQALVTHGNLDMSQIPANLLGTVQGLIDPATLAAAQQNPTSTMALLQQALQRGQAALPYQLQGQRSGAALIAGRRLNEGYQTQSKQALDQLLGVLTGGQAKFGAYSDQQRAVWEQAKAAIADRLARQAEVALQAKIDANRKANIGGGGQYVPPVEDIPQTDTSVWNPPESGPYEGYTPEGTYNPDTGYIEAPGGGQYGSGGGEVTYQSNQGKYGKKPLY